MSDVVSDAPFEMRSRRRMICPPTPCLYLTTPSSVLQRACKRKQAPSNQVQSTPVSPHIKHQLSIKTGEEIIALKLFVPFLVVLMVFLYISFYIQISLVRLLFLFSHRRIYRTFNDDRVPHVVHRPGLRRHHKSATRRYGIESTTAYKRHAFLLVHHPTRPVNTIGIYSRVSVQVYGTRRVAIEMVRF